MQIVGQMNSLAANVRRRRGLTPREMQPSHGSAAPPMDPRHCVGMAAFAVAQAQTSRADSPKVIGRISRMAREMPCTGLCGRMAPLRSDHIDAKARGEHLHQRRAPVAEDHHHRHPALYAVTIAVRRITASVTGRSTAGRNNATPRTRASSTIARPNRKMADSASA